jgi:hypothetical protein
MQDRVGFAPTSIGIATWSVCFQESPTTERVVWTRLNARIIAAHKGCSRAALARNFGVAHQHEDRGSRVLLAYEI